jgi:nickel-dependent lactate racemase
MSTILHYGVDSALRLDIPADALVAHCGEPSSPAIADPALATAAALDAPLDYPPFAKIAVPGDRVVLALAEGVPQAASIVAVVVDRLLAAGVEAADISLLQTYASGKAAERDALAGLPATIHKSVKILIHDPLDRNRLSYLAASKEAKPIYLNRALSEADLVVPIGGMRPAAALGYYGVYSGIFPAFSDAKTIERYRSPIASESAVQLRRFHREVEQVGRLLGVEFLIEVVPAAADRALAILAGRATSVARVGSQQTADAWTCTVPRRASLVLAGISGPAETQTWDNVGRALWAAARVVDEGGDIALCTDVDDELGPALRALRGVEHPQVLLRHIIHDRPVDTLVSVQLLHALERGRVYLLSRMDESVVEELGMAPIQNAEQVARLVGRHASCIVLANAQYSLATPDESHLSDAADTVETALEDAREEFE